MKKITIAILFVFTAFPGFGQENKSAFSISVEVGLNRSNMYGPDVQSETFLAGSYDNLYTNFPGSNKFKTGFNAGMLIDYQFLKNLSIGLGVGYIEKGARINANEFWSQWGGRYEELQGDIYWKQNYWTIEIPVTYYIPLKANDIYLQAGFFEGFLISSEESGENLIIDGESGFHYSRERRANDQEPGFFLGAGYLHSFKDSGSGLYAELVWARSFKSPGEDLFPRPKKFYNQSFSLNLGYRHKLKF